MRTWLLVCAIGAWGCAGDRPADAQGATPEAIVPAVEAVQSRWGTLPLVERLTGTARASGEVAIFPEVTGRIVEVMAENGASVSAGQPLVRLQTAEAQPQLAQARSQLAVTEAQVREAEAVLSDLRLQFTRITTLAERGLVSRQEVDTQRAQVDAAEAALARARAEVTAARAVIAGRAAVDRQSVVRAPIAGRIGQRNAEVGMLVDAQTQLFVVGQLDRMRIEVPAAQDVLAHIKREQRVEVTITPGEPPIVATVSRISPFLRAGSFSGEVEIDVPNDGALVPGMFVTVDVFFGESPATTLVPTSALYEDPTTGERGVFVIAQPPDPAEAAVGELGRDPVAVPFRAVEVIARGRQTMGVSGVEPGEWVVVVGQHLLSAASGADEARVRAVSWDHIVALQQLQREDLLQQFMQKQKERAAGAPD
jgi:HlyD family secretion protein